MIKATHLTKRYGRTLAIDNLSFEIKRGEVVGFLGPNGAGKTTLMRILACFLPATGGTVTVGDFDTFHHSLEVRRRVGYLPENVPLYPEMRVLEYLRYRGMLKGLRGKTLRARMEAVVGECELGDVRGRIIGKLSKGYRQRVGLADSLIHDPDVLILDEPTLGLDPNQIRHIRNVIGSLGRRHTVLLSSHILPEVEAVCERVFILNQGRMVASDTPTNLIGLLKGNQRVEAEIIGPPDLVTDTLKGLSGVVRVEWSPAGEVNHFVCECEKGVDIRIELSRAVLAKGWSLRELKADRRSLEDVFVAITGNANTLLGKETGPG